MEMMRKMLSLFWRFLEQLWFLAGYITSGNAFPKPLSPKEERECLQKLQEGNAAARNRLVEHNLRLVAHIAKKYSNESKENITYRFTLRLSDGSGFTDWKFKLVNATYSHTIGNIDAVSYTFTL